MRRFRNDIHEAKHRYSYALAPTHRHVYHVTHSYPLPMARNPSAMALPTTSEPSLVLRMPGKAPIQVPSFRLLEQLLGEQVTLAIEAAKAAKASAVARMES